MKARGQNPRYQQSYGRNFNKKQSEYEHGWNTANTGLNPMYSPTSGQDETGGVTALERSSLLQKNPRKTTRSGSFAGCVEEKCKDVSYYEDGYTLHVTNYGFNQRRIDGLYAYARADKMEVRLEVSLLRSVAHLLQKNPRKTTRRISAGCEENATVHAYMHTRTSRQDGGRLGVSLLRGSSFAQKNPRKTTRSDQSPDV